LLDAILASSAVPGVFPAIKIDDSYYVDGGVAYMASISDAIRQCFNKHKRDDIEVRVDVVLAISDVPYPGILENIITTPFVMFHTMSTVLNSMLIADIQNARISFPNAHVRVIKPSKFLPGWFLGFQYSQEMITDGYNDAKTAIQNNPWRK
jgi:predicted acylesterase/phospholipase RssA